MALSLESWKSVYQLQESGIWGHLPHTWMEKSSAARLRQQNSVISQTTGFGSVKTSNAFEAGIIDLRRFQHPKQIRVFRWQHGTEQNRTEPNKA